MQAFDPRSIILITFFVFLLQFFILLALSRLIEGRIPGVWLGAAAAGLWAAGAGLVVARGVAPAFASAYLGNICLSWATLLLIAALRDFRHGIVTSRKWLIGAGALYATGLWIAFASGNYQALLLTITGFNAAAYSACVLVWRGPARGFASVFLSCSLIFAFLVSAARFATLGAGLGAPSQLYDPVSFQRLYLGLVALSIIAILLAYILVVYDRIRALLERSNATLENEVRARTADLTIEIERKRDLERQISTTADAERRRVGNELHDDLGQRLTGISLVAEAMSGALRSQNADLAVHADAIQTAASGAIAQVRRLAHGLMPVGPEAEDLGEALEQLARSTSLSGASCRFERSPQATVTDQDVATNLYRIAQECVSNAIRHGMASRVSIWLDRTERGLRMRVEDNGGGFDPSAETERAGQGRGMGIIEFRASVIKFDLSVVSAPGQGCVVTVEQS